MSKVPKLVESIRARTSNTPARARVIGSACSAAGPRGADCADPPRPRVIPLADPPGGLVCWDRPVRSSAWYRQLRGTPLRRSVTEAVLLVLVGLALLGVGLGNVVATGLPWDWLELGVWWHAVPLVGSGVALLAKRHRPVGVLVAVLPMLAFDASLGGSLGMILVLIDVLYSATVHAGPVAVRRVGVGIGLVIAAGTATVLDRKRVGEGKRVRWGGGVGVWE